MFLPLLLSFSCFPAIDHLFSSYPPPPILSPNTFCSPWKGLAIFPWPDNAHLHTVAEISLKGPWQHVVVDFGGQMADKRSRRVRGGGAGCVSLNLNRASGPLHPQHFCQTLQLHNTVNLFIYFFVARGLFHFVYTIFPLGVLYMEHSQLAFGLCRHCLQLRIY